MKERIIEILKEYGVMLMVSDQFEDIASRIDQLYDLPTKEDVENEAWFYDGNAGRQNRSSGFSFMQGGLWVLSKIK